MGDRRKGRLGRWRGLRFLMSDKGSCPGREREWANKERR